MPDASEFDKAICGQTNDAENSDSGGNHGRPPERGKPSSVHNNMSVEIILTDNDIFHPYRYGVPASVHWVDSADNEPPARHPGSLHRDIKAMKREVTKFVRGRLSLLKEYLRFSTSNHQ
jgi:hypothetical protein